VHSPWWPIVSLRAKSPTNLRLKITRL